MVTCLVIELRHGKTSGHGAKDFETLPRIGEWIGIEEDGAGMIFAVKMVAHSSEYREGSATNGADIYVTRVGTETEALLSLHS